MHDMGDVLPRPVSRRGFLAQPHYDNFIWMSIVFAFPCANSRPAPPLASPFFSTLAVQCLET